MCHIHTGDALLALSVTTVKSRAILDLLSRCHCSCSILCFVLTVREVSKTAAGDRIPARQCAVGTERNSVVRLQIHAGSSGYDFSGEAGRSVTL